MGADSKIEWTDHSWNPWTGCQAVSPACDHCYAELVARRAPKTFGGWGPHAPRRRTGETYWRQPLAWNRKAGKEGRRARVFSASMGDIMDNQAPISWLADALDVMRITPQLIWLLLTKRPELIMRRLAAAMANAEARGLAALDEWLTAWINGAPPDNVWPGTTVENQTEAARRIPRLLAVPAARRFLSCEPLLGPLRLDRLPHGDESDLDVLRGRIVFTPQHVAVPPQLTGARIDWVIAGGESGPKARASHPDWFRSLRDQCQAADVPFFFKQWGEWAPADPADEQAPLPNGWRALRAHSDGSAPRVELYPEAGAAFVARIGKKASGALLDGREWREFPA